LPLLHLLAAKASGTVLIENNGNGLLRLELSA
jgi:hypothetical protein